MTLSAPAPAPPFAHLRALTDRGGLFEHADGTTIRREHGYCVDDVARALVVVCRELEPAGVHADLREHYLGFVLAAQDLDGRFRNRRDADLRWHGTPTVEDCWGRALWGLGAAVAHPGDAGTRSRALDAFERGAAWRSPWSRAMAFATLGAADVLRAIPDHPGAKALLGDAARSIGRPDTAAGWPWPEPRLTYANAALPEALLAAGTALGDHPLVDDGLLLLGWLLGVQTRDGHLSLAPVGGWGPADTADPAPTDPDPTDPAGRRGRAAPAFDQQPIEVAALADACARAYLLTGQRRWADGIELATAWFLGDNDAGTPLLDPVSGGGYDGLEAHGRNENQGAESTLALMSTLQQARWLSLCPR